MFNNCCQLWCLVASGLFGAMLYLMFNPNKNIIITNFQKSLTPEQNQVYNEITKERLNIYLVGLVIGLVVGFLYLKNEKNTLVRSCVFTVLVLAITHIVYLLAPKSKYMVTYLDTEEKRNKWLDVYKEMKYRHYMGFILGMIAYLLLSYNL